MIGPYFFKDDNGTTITINSDRYGHMITEFFLLAIEEYDLENMWFQQDDVPCYTIRAKIALLQETFPSSVGSVDINWPPSFAKDRVYADKLSTLEHLKTKIRQVTAEIPPNMR